VFTSYLFGTPFGYPAYSLIAASHAASRLASDYWPPTQSEQLARHPFYVVDRPGGCTCLMARVFFAVDTPDPQMERLTTFNLDCITRFRACRYLEDIYPAAEEWHLYDGTLGGRPLPPNKIHTENAQVPLACDVPLFARGREALRIIAVTALSESQERHDGQMYEKASVRVIASLKGPPNYKPGQVVAVTSNSMSAYSPAEIETPLTPGKQFLLLARSPEDKSQPLDLWRCLALSDTPEARKQLEAGAAENDIIRYPDPYASYFIPY
jgi:hypothetical protein